MTADGYSLDDKRTFMDGQGDIPDILERFENRFEEGPEDRKGKCFFVPVEDIIAEDYDLSINRYKVIEYEEVEYDPAEVILESITKHEHSILNDLDELKGLLER